MSKMLSSWKEIAHYFGKGVRTVQRWEKTLDLPIHRPPGAPSNVVLARTSDLEEWMHRGSVPRAIEKSDGHLRPESIDDVVSELEQEVRELSEAVGVQKFDGGTGSSAEEKLLAITAQVVSISATLSSRQTSRAA